jgi:ATPase subunit of ABC transporter with duplicated ATPase domains
MEGVAAKQAILDRYNESDDELQRRDRRRGGQLQDKIDAQGLWDLESQVQMSMDALRCPPGDADVNNLSGGEKRRVALCKLLLEEPTCCCSTSRRTTSMPRPSAGSKSI